MGKFQIEKLRNVVVKFKLPIAFDLLNSSGNNFKGNPYFVKIEGIPALIKTNRIYDFRWKEDFQIQEFSKIEEDRSGILSYSVIEVWFDEQIIESIKIDKDMLSVLSEIFVLLSIEYLNKFINIYRKFSNQFWIRNIIRNDIFTYQYFLIDSDENIDYMLQIGAEGEINFNGDKEFEIEEVKEKRFRHSLLEDHYSFEDDMVAFMHDNFHLGRYNLALVQGVTLFETFIYSELRKVIPSKTKLNKLKKKECGCLAGISEVCERGIKEYFDFDFGLTQEWDDIRKYVLRPRNKIVHGETIENIKRSDCEKGLAAIEKGENLLKKEVFK